MVELVCVPPEKIGEVWPHVFDLLKSAVSKCGDWRIEDIRGALDREAMLLWLTWDGSMIRAAATTEIVVVPKGRVCRAVACGGDDPAWPERFAQIENYARSEGCVSTRIHGRPGWARVFKDYKTEWIALEKRLD